MEERKEEISFILGMIDKLCKEYQVSIYPKERKGKLIMVIQDATTGEEYAMIKKEE